MTSNELFQEALAEARAGRIGCAEQKCQAILETDPLHIKANLMIGLAAARSGREGEAIARLTTVLDRDPNEFDALKWMAGALNRQGKFAEAGDYAKRAVAIRSEDYTCQLALAQSKAGVSSFEEAVAAYTEAVRIEPKRQAAYKALSHLLLGLGRHVEARLVLLEAARQTSSPWAYLVLAQISHQFGRLDEAIPWALKTPSDSPEYEPSLVTLAGCYGDLGKAAEQAQTLDLLAEINPKNPFIPMLRGFALQYEGRFVEAEEEFLRSIQAEPKGTEAYHGIVSGRPVVDSDLPLIDKMERVLASGGLSPRETAPLQYALGKAYDDLGRYEEAMEHFVDANRAMKLCQMGSRSFDRKSLERDVDRTIDLFTKEYLLAHQDERVYAPIPIIIAGAMRSGTTLVEQILSSHPRVGAAGEQTFWRGVAGKCLEHDPFDPEAGVHHEVIRKKAWEYIKSLRSIASDSEFVTDKDPGNHRLFGIIRLALPNSPIIQMRRNPVDVAISIFTTYFHTAEEFVWDRSDIVFALKQHARLEAHWREVLPTDLFLEIDYAILVSNPEPVIRRLIDFCGLGWDDACLRSESNPHKVKTPSFWQVRQPVNPGSIDRWRRYKPWLGPLEELVADINV